MKKIISAILLIASLLALSSCGKTEEVRFGTPEEIANAIMEVFGDKNLCDTKVDDETLPYLIDFDLDKIEAYAAYQNSVSSLNLDTIVVLKTKDGYADEAVEALNAHYKNLVSYSKLYTFGAEKVAGARLYKNGNTVIFALCGASDATTDEGDNVDMIREGYDKIDGVLKAYVGNLENLAAK